MWPMLIAGLASGAMGGLSSYFGGKDQGSEFKYDYHPMDKQFKRASQALIPIYLKLLTGGVPNFLKRYLNQTQATALNQANIAAKNYLSQVGRGGMQFGPQVAAGLSKIYEGVTPAVVNAMSQVRASGLQPAMQGLQQWSTFSPLQTGTQQTQPGAGYQAGAGALQGLQYGLGQVQTGQPKAPITGPPAPYATPTPNQAYNWANQQGSLPAV